MACGTPTLYSDYVIDNVNFIPEPGVLTLLAMGGLCLLGLGYRRRNRRV